MGNGQQGFFDRSLVIRGFLGLVIACMFTLFFQFQAVPRERLSLHAPAAHDVVAAAAFVYPDEEQTMLARQEMMGRVGQVYRVPPDLMEEVDDQSLGSARFVDAGTLAMLEQLGLSTPHLFSLSGELSETIPGVLQEQEDAFQEDPEATAALRRQAARVVPQAMTQVTVGSRLVEQGEPVTTQHIAVIEAYNAALMARRDRSSPYVWGGSILLALLFVGGAGWYLRRYDVKIYGSNRRLCLTAVILMLTLVLSKGAELLLHTSSMDLGEPARMLVVVPFAAILLGSLVGVQVALFVSALLSLAMALALSFGGIQFLFINMTAALVAVFTTHSLRRRKEVFIVCGWAWLAAILVVLALHAYGGSLLGWSLFIDLVITCVSLLVTAVLVVGLLPLLESVFGVITDVTLMEFMDPTHPLLRKLSAEAPGTYQHSLVVGNLAEAAAVAIGANGLFCRVAALYHDIGKVVSPEYFTENQSEGMVDPHQLLTPLESALALMAHVPEGVAIARRHGIPDVIIDVIKQHHGNTKVSYFYHQAKTEGSEVSEQDFRYAGPTPCRRETAILMIADTAEAASRSLDEITEESLTRLIDRLVREKAEDGQFDSCELTFEELATVKRTVVRSLLAAGHARIKYPLSTPSWSDDSLSADGASV